MYEVIQYAGVNHILSTFLFFRNIFSHNFFLKLINYSFFFHLIFIIID